MDNPTSKRTCTICNKDKSQNEFYAVPQMRDGLANECKECRRAATTRNRRERYRLDPVLAWAKVSVQTARKRAHYLGLAFALTVSDLVENAPTHCPALGIELDYGLKGSPGGRHNSPSLDRLIPRLGYVLDNIAIVSMRANSIKQDATPDEICRVGAFYTSLLYGNTHLEGT